MVYLAIYLDSLRCLSVMCFSVQYTGLAYLWPNLFLNISYFDAIINGDVI